LLSQVQPVLTSQNLLCQDNLSHPLNRPKKWLETDLKRFFSTSDLLPFCVVAVNINFHNGEYFDEKNTYVEGD
jgi:hypothetical protein